ncbi:MAG: aryl-sulfate sulfotransferase [Myxococcota bacterium]
MLLAALSACEPPPDDAPAASDCALTGIVEGVDVALDEGMPTYATVSLTLTETADVSIVAIAEGAPEVAGPVRVGQSGAIAVPLHGMRPSSTYAVRVRATTGAGCEEVVAEVATGELPGTPPELEVLTDDGSHEGYLMVGGMTVGDDSTGVTMVDRGGVAVWHHEAPGLMYASPTSDGAGFYLARAGIGGPGAIDLLDLGGDLVRTVEVEYVHHSATDRVPDVAFATLVEVVEEDAEWMEACGVDATSIAGDAIVEVAADGTVTEAWNAFEALSRDCPSHDRLNSLGHLDWTHLNAIDYDPDLDAWLVSFYWDSMIALIDRPTGEITFRSDDCGLELSQQHGARFAEGGFVAYDNHAVPARMVRVQADFAAGTCGDVEVFEHPDGLSGNFLGNIRVEGDRWYTAWGDVGDVMVIDGGEIVWRAAPTEDFEEDHGGLIAASTAWLPNLYGE